jgi:hypothetical protein
MSRCPNGRMQSRRGLGVSVATGIPVPSVPVPSVVIVR